MSGKKSLLVVLVGIVLTTWTSGCNQQPWVPVMRMAKEVDFPWKPDTWYTMKFRAAVEQVDGKPQAILRGKIWPKGEPEPEQWTVEAIDKAPNLTGSPGLYGNAKDAELYLDNLSVTPNND